MGQVFISSAYRMSRRVGPPPWSPTPNTYMQSLRPVFFENSITVLARCGPMRFRYQAVS